METFLTPEQVAERLQLSKATVYRWLRRGKLKGCQLSCKAWRMSESNLTAFIDEQTKKTRRRTDAR